MNSGSSALSDEHVVRLALRDPRWIGALIRRYGDRLVAYVRRSSGMAQDESEDVVQDSFIKAYKNLNSFDVDLKFSTWMYQITRNTMMDVLRAHARKPVVGLDDAEVLRLVDMEPNPYESASLRGIASRVRAAVGELPEAYREVLVLRYLEDKSYEEIVDIVRKPKGTVASLMNRGRSMLRKELKNEL